jgi:recombination protein U
VASRGKEFEKRIKEALDKVDGMYAQRLYDSQAMTSYPSDFIAYKYPNLYLIECKSHLGRLPLSCISENQWKYMTSLSKLRGISAYVIVWFVDYNITKLFDITYLNECKGSGIKSIKYDDENGKVIKAKKKRTYFNYDLNNVF